MMTAQLLLLACAGLPLALAALLLALHLRRHYRSLADTQPGGEIRGATARIGDEL